MELLHPREPQIREELGHYDNLVSNTYNNRLQDEGTPIKAYIITLEGVSPDRRQQLESKLEDYTNRIIRHGGISKEFVDRVITGARYKRDLLRLLLTNEEVNVTVYEQLPLGPAELQNDDLLANAAAVINDYVESGGQDVKGGTGLH